VGNDKKTSADDAGNEFEELIKQAADEKSEAGAVDESETTEDNENGHHAPDTDSQASTTEQTENIGDYDVVIAESRRNKEGWQRTLAEFQNYKRRTERELADGKVRYALDIIAQILPIIDDFERALDNIPEDIADNPWVSGTALIGKKFEKLLDEYDIEIIEPTGEIFDPNRHEAIGTDDDSEFDSGHVSVTLQKGYTSGDRVLRPALVRVAS